MAGSAPPGQAAVSAHRGGGEDAPGGTHEAYLASARFPDVHVGLSLGRDVAGLPAGRKVRTRASELFPLPRIRASGANWCAVHHRLAVAGVLRQCHRQAIKTMVWTVNDDAMIGRLLADPRVDVLVTDRPRQAIALRGRPR